jgi:dephospho-CoA kinase
VFAGKPVIGIAGGIGSGKSFVAKLFGEAGCAVIDSDAQVKAAYWEPAVKRTLRAWWGGEVFKPDGEINRSEIARRIFADDAERRRLEGLIHPLVAEARDRQMTAAANDPQVVAYVWDTPLLFETGLNEKCDAVVFVDAPEEQRVRRVAATRGWDEAELLRRQKLQWPLDRKGQISDYVLTNTADADYARGQVREVLSRILARSSNRPEQSTGGSTDNRSGL